MIADDLDLTTWFARAKPGDSVEYWRGFICRDISKDHCPDYKTARARKTWTMELADAGMAHLVQKRHGTGDYSYFVVKKGKGEW